MGDILAFPVVLYAENGGNELCSRFINGRIIVYSIDIYTNEQLNTTSGDADKRSQYVFEQAGTYENILCLFVRMVDVDAECE